MGLITQTVLWVGLATSMIYIVSGFAQYAMGRRIIDRYPLKTTYVDGLGAAGRGDAGPRHGQRLCGAAGAIFSAVLSAAAGPVENIMIARYTPSNYHGLGFGAKFVVALWRQPARHPADRLGPQAPPATSTCCSSASPARRVVITAVALLLPNERSRSTAIAAPQAAPAE